MVSFTLLYLLLHVCCILSSSRYDAIFYCIVSPPFKVITRKNLRPCECLLERLEPSEWMILQEMREGDCCHCRLWLSGLQSWGCACIYPQSCSCLETSPLRCLFRTSWWRYISSSSLSFPYLFIPSSSQTPSLSTEPGKFLLYLMFPVCVI